MIKLITILLAVLVYSSSALSMEKAGSFTVGNKLSDNFWDESIWKSRDKRPFVEPMELTDFYVDE